MFKFLLLLFVWTNLIAGQPKLGGLLLGIEHEVNNIESDDDWTLRTSWGLAEGFDVIVGQGLAWSKWHNWGQSRIGFAFSRTVKGYQMVGGYQACTTLDSTKPPQVLHKYGRPSKLRVLVATMATWCEPYSQFGNSFVYVMLEQALELAPSTLLIQGGKQIGGDCRPLNKNKAATILKWGTRMEDSKKIVLAYTIGYSAEWGWGQSEISLYLGKTIDDNPEPPFNPQPTQRPRPKRTRPHLWTRDSKWSPPTLPHWTPPDHPEDFPIKPKKPKKHKDKDRKHKKPKPDTPREHRPTPPSSSRTVPNWWPSTGKVLSKRFQQHMDLGGGAAEDFVHPLLQENNQLYEAAWRDFEQYELEQVIKDSNITFPVMSQKEKRQLDQDWFPCFKQKMN